MGDNVDLVVGFRIPSHLVDAFDDFVTASVAALDGMGDRSEWAQDEREIVEWMESDKWKPNSPICVLTDSGETANKNR